MTGRLALTFTWNFIELRARALGLSSCGLFHEWIGLPHCMYTKTQEMEVTNFLWPGAGNLHTMSSDIYILLLKWSQSPDLKVRDIGPLMRECQENLGNMF